MFEEKNDRPVTINHRLGKVKLHTRAMPDSLYKVQLLKNEKGAGDFLFVHTRGVNRSWYGVDPSRENQAFWQAIREFLELRQCRDQFFLSESELKDLLERFQKAATAAA